MKRLSLLVLLVAAICLAAVDSADSQRGRRGMGGGGMKKKGPGGRPSPEIIGAFSPKMADLDHMRAKGFVETGLVPVYPKNADCLIMNSPFGSDSRGDGSFRTQKYYNGYHGGMDIPAPEGTPILAVAAGRVIQKKEGEGIGGIGMMLQHSPEDTGLGVWTYTEYKHLREMPDLEIGQRVEMGEVIAPSGDTGTQGGYYGLLGHAHLHFTAFFSPGNKYIAKRIFVPLKGEWMDPMALYKGGPTKSAELKALPDDQKSVKFAYKTTTGKIVPEGAKVVWPFACKPK